jgi:O-antigen/teichoic acid export membrane protein
MIAQKVSFAFFNSLIIHILGFVSLFVVARYMGPEALGIIAFAFAYLKIFSSFSSLGFGSAHIKRVSEGKDFGKCNGTYFTAKLILTFVMAAVVIATIFITKFVQHKSFISTEHEIVLYIVLLATVVGNLSMMFILTFGARKETAKQNAPLVLEKIVVVAVKVVVAVTGLGVVLLACANLLGAIVALFCFLYLFRGYPIKRPDKQFFRSYLKFALPVMFIGILADVAHNMDKVIIQFFWDTADVGYYSAAQRISLVFTFITTASATLIFPTISNFHAKGDISAIRKLSRNAERYLSMIFAPVIAFTFVFAQAICSIILGNQFSASAPLLIVLMCVVFVNGTSIPYAQQLGGTNRVALAAKLSVVVFGIDILLNIVFVPQTLFGIELLGLGKMGAALSTLISMSIGALLFRFNAYRVSNSRPNGRIILHLLASAIMGIVLHFASASVKSFTVFHLLVFGLIACGIYLAILWIIGEFDENDFRLFLKILNPLQLKKYAISEIKAGYRNSA